jgi:MFS family permease
LSRRSFFAAYVPAVPVLLALTDRLPARTIYLVGTGLTALSHFGFATLADGFWSGLLMRALAGVGWAGAYMPGLKAIADPLQGVAQSRAVSWHAAGVGIAGAVSFAVAGILDAVAGPRAAFLFGAASAVAAFVIAVTIMPRTFPRHTISAPLPPRFSTSAPCSGTAARWPGSSVIRCTPGSSLRCGRGR